MKLFSPSLFRFTFGKAPPCKRRRPSYRPTVEMLEDRAVPALVGSQVLPLMTPGALIPPGLSLPPGFVVPPGAILPPGIVLPPGVVLPPGIVLPPGVVL